MSDQRAGAEANIITKPDVMRVGDVGTGQDRAVFANGVKFAMLFKERGVFYPVGTAELSVKIDRFPMLHGTGSEELTDQGHHYNHSSAKCVPIGNSVFV